MTGRAYTVRQAAYDLRKIRGKQLVDKPGRGRRYHLPTEAARTIAALLTLRDHVIAQFWPGCAAHAWAANRRPGPPSTATTNASASACTPCSATSASAPPHRQQIVEPRSASA